MIGSALFLEELPSSMIVIGGGYIGTEFAQMYGRFGTQVTLLGRNRQLVPGEDPELADLLAEYLHVATYDGPIAALNAVKGLGRGVDYRVVPRAIFSDPTLAAVGLTEAEAREQGYDVVVGSVPADGARAKAIGDRRGRLRAVVDRATSEILGYHILASHGDDLLHEAVVAMHEGGRIERISKSIHVHPTLSEMVKAAVKAAR